MLQTQLSFENMFIQGHTRNLGAQGKPVGSLKAVVLKLLVGQA